MACLADVTDPNSVKSMIEATMKKFGRIDILIHNAVARDASHLSELTLERWHQALAVVLDGAFLSAQRVKIATQGHLPFAAGALAVYETLKALREGTSPKDLKGLPSAEFVNRYMRNATVQQRMSDFLGIKKS